MLATSICHRQSPLKLKAVPYTFGSGANAISQSALTYRTASFAVMRRNDVNSAKETMEM